MVQLREECGGRERNRKCREGRGGGPKSKKIDALGRGWSSLRSLPW